MTDTHINTDMSPRAFGLTSLFAKMRKSNHLKMLEQRQHLLLNYFKTLSVGPAGNRAQASRTMDWATLPTNRVSGRITVTVMRNNAFVFNIIIVNVHFKIQ